MGQQIQVIDTDYRIEEGKVVVRLFGKDANGKNILCLDRNFLPYFYAIPHDIKEAKQDIESSSFEQEGEKLPVERVEEAEMVDLNQEVEVLKVYTTIPPKVPKLRKQVGQLESVKECREFDIPFYKRYLIDKGISPATWIEVEGQQLEDEGFDLALEVKDIDTGLDGGKLEFETLAFDLEVYENKVIMASMYSKDFKRLLTTEEIGLDYVETVEDEKELINRFIEVIEQRDVDVVTGYNTDEFDFQVLRERAEHHGFELSMGRAGERMKFNQRGRFSGARLKGRMHLDLYPFVAHIMQQSLESEVLDLDSVAEEILGRRKDEMSWEEMKQSWREKEDLERFAEYAMKDSELAFELGKEIIPQILELSRIAGLIPFDACRLTYGQLTENYLLREAHERDMLALNRPSRDERSKRRRQKPYEGGFVYTPEAGLYDDIVLLDFRSLYPTVMVAHNISPDTLNLQDCNERFELEEFDYDFCQDSQGFFPELVERLVEDRLVIKEKMTNLNEDSRKYRSLNSRQQAEKILANSFYGYLGYSGARWYSRECAEATTFLGRKYIQDSIREAEEQGFEIVYGDTDSLFLKGENIRERIDGFIEKVNNELPEFMELEFEGYFERGFFTSTESGKGAKKKYALLSEDGDLKITGFEHVRRDWSPLAKETQKKVLEKVLGGEVDEAASMVKHTIEELQSGEVPVENLKIYTQMKKKPENYESTAPHVEAAKKAIERGEEIPPGTTIDYVITRGSDNISSRAELTKYAENYDSNYYIDNQIIPVSLRVLKVFGYTSEQLRGEGKQSGLERFG